ncbi:hypothetical protein [[Mycobacterium] wendilense]|uniref:Secretion protein n=1 Tax=[Mycobacterium] wendilense TaxID=3064284 RepID=A0ABM9M7W8_9MYCO|nr:hypothetical protein [Mycolicibacterium sp. MU0050]CAJ1578403.1 hypothetical protein MU0050_000065 [Mycolicibacterium sp. MU0050]
MEMRYNIPQIMDAGDGVNRNAAGLLDNQGDVENRFAILLGSGMFDGDNSFNFGDHQAQFMQAFKHLIQTVEQFSRTVHTVAANTQAQDAMLASGL